MADKMPKEERKKKWASFIVGNLLTIGSVVYELVSLDLCFVEGETNRNTIGLTQTAGTSGQVRGYLVAALWLGAVYEALSAFVLSSIYSAPIVLPIFACCCKCTRTCSNKLLKTFPVIDVIWQLQSVIFGYRSGTFSVYVAAALGVVEVVAACFTEYGSFFPPPARVLAGVVEV